MHLLRLLIEQYGLLLVFANVLLLQLGLPLPAYPTLLTVGALAAAGLYPPAAVIAVAVAASVIADLLWYRAGSRSGRRVLSLMCRLSLSPDSCVRQSESIYERFGPPSLLVAKFIPGFAAIATAMAGVVRTRLASFVVFDALGAMLWSATAVALGWFFRDAIEDVLAALESAGRWGLLLLGAALTVFVAAKAWQRFSFKRRLHWPRIEVDELAALLASDRAPLIVDVRSEGSHAQHRLPNAVRVDSGADASALATQLDRALASARAETEVVVYCACPNEASAVLVGQKLAGLGFRRVTALRGGIDAWVAAGGRIDGTRPDSTR